MTIGKKELADRVAKRTGQSPTATHATIDATVDEIAAVVKRGGEVKIPGFGTFEEGFTGKRRVRSFGTGESIEVAPQRRARLVSDSVKFKGSRGLNKIIS